MTAPVLIGCAGFLLGVLWIDLIFDNSPELAAVAAYYHRATTTSQPRGALIAAVMLILLAALVVEVLAAATPGWLLAAWSVAGGGPIALALLRTVPAAVRLGRRTDDLAEQARLAGSIRRDHRLCLAGMAVFLALVVAHTLSSN